ncbi:MULTISPECIES: DUF190 domain-containing protein [Brenneria]|uniref:DUF190 domain-containing protein n=1 Tax=Brenneria nigrifluens DSM 30175 = ATCC 13028 TaxID=1121120 RepID=A0A2U1UHG0_9GAMM|nr:MULTISPECIES: DUF190 domain-containing protein [Brenneria]EHD20472.1 hypothetical protein BrE312_1042 [Brenneria sp. EniD312]PWC21118.1 hypothetical protein DDT54_19575 [Brenneria nigrifluens DSM 30175 = ATCC 13028]QCR03671.1 DUF190 domain-containing protein [Brenneria nigrifluens DSM 30175 = ATCC 13028]
MQGYQVTFFTQQDRTYGSLPLAQWLLDAAKKLGIRGGTLSGAIQGTGHDGLDHSINMFDLSDQPVQVTLVISPEQTEQLFDYLNKEHIKVFFVKIPVEFGVLGKA